MAALKADSMDEWKAEHWAYQKVQQGAVLKGDLMAASLACRKVASEVV